jgi:hypothetical protein
LVNARAALAGLSEKPARLYSLLAMMLRQSPKARVESQSIGAGRCAHIAAHLPGAQDTLPATSTADASGRAADRLASSQIVSACSASITYIKAILGEYFAYSQATGLLAAVLLIAGVCVALIGPEKARGISASDDRNASPAASAGELRGPRRVARDNSRVATASARGEWLMSWGSFGTRPGPFATPHGVAVAPAGQVFVADRGNRRIQVADQSGTAPRPLRLPSLSRDQKVASAVNGDAVPPGILSTAQDTMNSHRLRCAASFARSS